MKHITSVRILAGAGRIGLVTALLIAMGMFFPSSASAQAGYEGGKGLITLEGPSGLFINPTSGTFPEKAATAQYCVYFPNNKTDVVGHGALVSYGLTDAIEVGGQYTYVDRDAGRPSSSAGGPNARIRLLKDDGMLPELSVVGWSRFIGDDELDKWAAAVAAFKRFPIEEDGAIRSVGIHAGVKYLEVSDEAAGANDDSSVAGYTGLEVQLPLRLYAVGEVSTKDSDFGDLHTPYAFGVQWRAAGLAMSIAGIQNGGVDDPSFYYGIGYSGSL